MLQPRDKGMLATTLALSLRGAAGGEIFDEIGDTKLPAEMLDIAQEIINRMSGHFEPDTFTDRYEEAVVAMLRAKQEGQTFTMPEPAAPANVVNIMDALKKSLEAAGGEGAVRRPRAPSKTAGSARRQGGRAQACAQETRGAQSGARIAGRPVAPRR